MYHSLAEPESETYVKIARYTCLFLSPLSKYCFGCLLCMDWPVQPGLEKLRHKQDDNSSFNREITLTQVHLYTHSRSVK